MEATVILPVRNAATLLSGQLRALSRQLFTGAFEVVVVDNLSTDDSKEVALAWRDSFERLAVVPANQRKGVGHARNVGVAASRTSKLLFCDADDEVDAQWIQAMVSELDSYPLAGGPLDLCRLNSPRVVRWRPESSRCGLPVSMGYLPYAVGANMAFRRHAYEALGGCDEDFVGGHEEVDLCWRAQQAGYELTFAQAAVVNYRLRDTLSGLARQRFASGRTYVQLYARHRDAIRERNDLGKELLRQGRLLARAPGLCRAGGPGRLVFDAAWQAGRLVGSVAYRSLAPG